MGNYEWSKGPPTVSQRIVAGGYLAVLLMLGANNYFGWRMLGTHGKQAVAGWTFVGLVLIFRFMPSVRRVK